MLGFEVDIVLWLFRHPLLRLQGKLGGGGLWSRGRNSRLWLASVAELSLCIYFSRFGFPRQLHSDQGKNFESKLFSEICKLAGITKTRTTPFHPRSDGETERMNRTIFQMLRACVHDNPSSWPDKITAILSAYRMTVQKTTGLTPNKAMLGREVLLPVALLAKPPDEPDEVTTSFAHTFRDTMRDAHEQIRHTTRSVAKTQKPALTAMSKACLLDLDS